MMHLSQIDRQRQRQRQTEAETKTDRDMHKQVHLFKATWLEGMSRGTSDGSSAAEAAEAAEASLDARETAPAFECMHA